MRGVSTAQWCANARPTHLGRAPHAEKGIPDGANHSDRAMSSFMISLAPP
jgi:hypothetical protein